MSDVVLIEFVLGEVFPLLFNSLCMHYTVADFIFTSLS